MKRLRPLTDEDGEVRELMAADLARFHPGPVALPSPLAVKVRKLERRPRKASTNERVAVRLSHDVVDRFRATGHGWQSRIDAALRDWLDTHLPP
jgi:uncharacterized protein (DUF4415 family)